MYDALPGSPQFKSPDAGGPRALLQPVVQRAAALEGVACAARRGGHHVVEGAEDEFQMAHRQLPRSQLA